MCLWQIVSARAIFLNPHRKWCRILQKSMCHELSVLEDVCCHNRVLITNCHNNFQQ